MDLVSDPEFIIVMSATLGGLLLFFLQCQVVLLARWMAPDERRGKAQSSFVAPENMPLVTAVPVLGPNGLPVYESGRRSHTLAPATANAVAMELGEGGGGGGGGSARRDSSDREKRSSRGLSFDGVEGWRSDPVLRESARSVREGVRSGSVSIGASAP